MSLNQPLTDKEFDDLDRFLLSERTPEDTMAMDILHGFLTAIVIGTENIPSSEWLPKIWGTEHSQKFQFESEKEEKRITKLILRFMNEIVVTFEVAPKEYEPLFCEHDWDGQLLLDAAPWAMGFWEGMCLRQDAWKPIWDAETAHLLRPIYLLGSNDAEKDILNDPISCHQLSLEIEKNVPHIYHFWQAHSDSK